VGIIEKSAARLTPPVTTSAAATPSAAAGTPAAPSRSEPGRSSSKRVDLNLARLQEAGMVTPDGERSSIAEEFRIIKRSLITQAFEAHGPSGRPNNLIMVTSSLPGEGKTFCAINLAISIAMELDHTVMLVDADVARPSLLRSLDLQQEAGLMDLLLDPKLDVGDVMLKTNINALSILPSGSSHRNATELLASQTMSRLLDELANRYRDRILIFDSPPLLPTSEARVLASQMGQIVMVVEGEKTTQSALKNSLRQMASCPNIKLIYNKAKAFRGEELYGYYAY
jgi:protein-tyrosine kinase